MRQIEDRSEAILRYEGNEIKSDGFVSINRKLKQIKKIAENKKSLPHRYFTPELIDEVLAWKEKRNPMIHAMMKRSFTTEGLKALADEGLALVKTMNRLSTNYKRAVERQQKKKEV